MTEETIWGDEARAHLMHVYPSTFWHGDVTIRCTQEALDRLAGAFADGTLRSGGHIAMMCNDGEGYHLVIEVKTESEMDGAANHYSTPGHDFEWVSYEAHEVVVKERDALLAKIAAA